MSTVRLIKIKEEILADNKGLADTIRARLSKQHTFMLNVMASPGGGKTSLIIETIARLGSTDRMAVIEADIDSTVDSDKVAETGVRAVQIETGGFCHVDAAMVNRALEDVDMASADLVFIENVGNLVCPAESDTGAHKNLVILSVPEGDDKPLKYPTMFAAADVIVLNKIDYLEIADFDVEAFRTRVSQLAPHAPLFEVSCRTGDGIEAWCDWLRKAIQGGGRDGGTS